MQEGDKIYRRMEAVHSLKLFCSRYLELLSNTNTNSSSCDAMQCSVKQVTLSKFVTLHRFDTIQPFEVNIALWRVCEKVSTLSSTPAL